MNKEVPFLTRQIAYSFLVGLIAGGLFIGLFDAYANKPLFSDAHVGSTSTNYCINSDNPNERCVEPGGGAGPSESGYGEVLRYQINNPQ